MGGQCLWNNRWEICAPPLLFHSSPATHSFSLLNSRVGPLMANKRSGPWLWTAGVPVIKLSKWFCFGFFFLGEWKQKGWEQQIQGGLRWTGEVWEQKSKHALVRELRECFVWGFSWSNQLINSREKCYFSWIAQKYYNCQLHLFLLDFSCHV